MLYFHIGNFLVQYRGILEAAAALSFLIYTLKGILEIFRIFQESLDFYLDRSFLFQGISQFSYCVFFYGHSFLCIYVCHF